MPAIQPEGYLAVPPSGTGDGVLVLHAWWGLNDTIKAICTRLSDAGFITFAPDLYHGKVAKTIPEAEALGSALDANYAQAQADIVEGVEFLSKCVGESDRGLAVLAFSLGAYYALQLAEAVPEKISSVILFYGTGGDSFSNSRAAYLGHFAEHDQFDSRESVDALEEGLRAAGRPVTFYHYPGTEHWFFEPDRPNEFNQEAAELAWDRTIEFLQRPRTA